MSEWRDAKRFLAKLLAFAMVLGNVFNGSVVAVAAERGESATAVFTMTGEDLQNAVESAKESGSPVSFDDMGLSGSETLLAEYRKVLGEGEVYQIQAGYTTESVNEAELTLYYNAGSDELIFFYENNDIVPVSFRTVVDGYATEAVSVRPYESEVATTSNAAYFLPDIVPEYESDVITEDADTEMQEEDIQETDILRARDESFREIAAATGSDAETETGEETESESGRKTKESAETEGSKSTEPESEIEINGTISGRRLGTVVVGECANAAAYIANYSALLKQLGMDISGAYEETVSLDDGSEILVKVPADAFDEKVEFCAVPIKTEAEITALKGTVTKAWDKDQRVTDLRAFDLSFCNEAGEEAVPSVPVEVTITLPARLNTEITPSETIQEVVKEIGIQVYHVPQAGGAEPVMSSSDSAKTVFTFETASFSPFVVLASAKVESVIDFDQVRTFDQLKAAIENVPVAEATSSDAARITVVESFDITGKIEIPKKKKILLTSPASSSNALKRAETYKGDLFDVSGELTLTNITLDGNREKVTAADGSLVEVKKSGKLNIQDGAILRNNETRSSVYRTEVAGAVNNAGTMSMTGGSIEYNSAAFGSGVYNTGNFTFSGGEIRKNNCVAAYSESGTGNGAGGGVLIANGGSMTMSETGKISDNTAPYGGGIAVGASYVDFINGTQTFTMEGGRIEGNTASVSGGGLYIQMNGVADITKGELIENHCNVDITTSRGSFGGGGVYVNGGKSAGYTNGLLLLKNAEISGNTADISGGGIAACPTSNVNIYLTDGGVFYGNEAKGNVETWTEGRVPEIGKDIFVTSVYPSLTEIDKLYISGYMLGGGAYHWREDSGEEVALNDVGNVDLDGALDGVNDNIALHTEKGRGDADIEKAHDMATVFIIGNTSTKRGGGIGTNGDVEIGTKDDVIQIRVTKKWSGDEDNVSLRPDRIKVWLLRSEDGTAFERVGYGWLEKAADGTWPTLVFEEQPRQFTGEANQKLDYIYKVEEETIDHYKPEYSDVEKDNGGNFAVAITNTFEMTTNLEVNKVWRAANGTDETRENLPGSITVNLYRVKGETETLVKSATLTAETDWKYRFTDLELLEEGETWKITENTVSNWNGAISEIGGDAIGGYTVTITNVYTPPPTPPPPVTPPPTPTPTPTPPPTPTPTPPPTPTPSPTPTPTPVNIPDNPTPLMSIPDEPTPLTNFENIMDEEVPLAAAPMTGDEKPAGMAALIGIAALGLMGVFGILGRRKDEEA